METITNKICPFGVKTATYMYNDSGVTENLHCIGEDCLAYESVNLTLYADPSVVKYKDYCGRLSV
jgi:hypothetical protein